MKENLTLRHKISPAYEGYVCSVGYTLSETNKKRQKDFYLGNDKSKALQLQVFINTIWENCKGQGNPIWTADHIQQVQSFKQTLYGKTSAVHLPKVEPIIEPDKKTFYQLIDEYCQKVIPTVIGSDFWKQNLKDRFEYLKRSSSDFLIGQLDHQKLAELAAYFKNRPLTQYGQPISVSFVETMIRTLKRFLTWAYEWDKWQAPKGWEKILRLQGWKPLLSDDELLEQSKSTAAASNLNDRFSIDELVLLYQTASEQTKTYILLALNCGFTQSEISNLMVGEIYLRNNPPMIARARKKVTKINKPVVSKWTLWEETITVLQDLMERELGEKSQLKKSIIRKVGKTGTEVGWSTDIFNSNWLYGKPLIHRNANGTKIDLIKNAWFRLLQNPKVQGKVRPLPFKYLRKTGADIIREISDSSIAQLYLSHTPTTTANKHYINPNYQRLFDALQTMRDKLAPLFEPQTVTV